MRNKIIAGNWKMNNDQSQTETLLNNLKPLNKPEDVSTLR